MTRYFYTVITGQGLGVSNSSLQQAGDVLPSKGLGQGDVKLFINAATGNLVVRDQVLRLSELDGAHEFYHVYNSQATSAANAWRFAHKQFTQLPALNPPGATAILTEADGHQTLYTLDQSRGAALSANLPAEQKGSTASVFYFAPGLENGTPWLRFDSQNNQWMWYHPGTKITEIYNTQGYLLKRIDAQGRYSTFEYNNGLLTAINAPSGTRYELRRATSVMQIYAIKNTASKKAEHDSKDSKDSKLNDSAKLLQSYTYDGQGRLATSTTEGGYTTTYKHFPNADTRLESITQSDNTVCSINFEFTHNGTLVLKNLRTGATDRMLLTLNSNTTSTVKDAVSGNATIGFDPNNNNRITQVTRELGYQHVTGTEVTAYQYAPTGQLATIVRPDGGQEVFEYKNIYGLCTLHSQPNGQVTSNTYQPGNNEPNLSLSQQTLADAKTSPTTRYVYDNQPLQHFLRFEISPLGRVTEHKPDTKGNRASTRRYFGQFFPVSNLQPGATPSIDQMVSWAGAQNQSQVTLAEYLYDYRGLCTDTRQYTAVDNKGEGVVTPDMSWEHLDWDDRGGCIRKQVLQKVPTQKVMLKDAKDEKQTQPSFALQDNPDSTYAVTTQQFDTALHRLTSVTDAENNTTDYKYSYDNKQAQIQITRPNKRQEVKQLDTQGVATSEVMTTTDQKEPRETTYMLDTEGRRIVTTHPDQTKTFTFFDKQNRLGFEVNRLGGVTQHEYNNQYRFHKKTQYSKEITIKAKEFWPFPNIPPNGDDLIKIIAEFKPEDHIYDRTSYEFFDANNRLYYQVDALGYITRTIYDNLGRHTGTVLYADTISSDALKKLLLGQDPNIQIDVTRDRFTQYFYDDDNYLIAELNTAGYMTEYKRDPGGRVTEKICYADPTTAKRLSTNTLADVRPQLSDEDAHTYKFYDNRDQCISAVDPEGYIIERSYLANGKPDITKRYAIPVPKSWYDNKSLRPTPVIDDEDQIVKHKYDLLGREVLTDTSVGKDMYAAFDCMGHTRLTRHVDVKPGMSLDADHMRTVEKQFDGWEQTTAEANPYIGQQIAAIETDGSLNKDQKIAAIAKIWAENSLRHTYDPTGLKLSSKDTRNNVTFYYYNLERKPIFAVDATGAVIENTLNTFGDVEKIRKYANRVDANTLGTLKGGFLPDALREYFEKLQDKLKDAVTENQVDKRGQATQVTDPEGYITINKYDAFKKCTVEQKPVDRQQPTLTIKHDFDTRGLEKQTTQQNGNLTAITKRDFKNMYSKETTTSNLVSTANNGIWSSTKNTYDRRGRIKKETDPLGQSTTYTHDAFDRVDSKTDALSQTTRYVYNQTKRTKTVVPPVANTQVVITANVFDEKTAVTNAMSQTHALRHAPNGKIATTTDALKNTTQDVFDTEGNHRIHIDAKNVNTEMVYNGANQLRQQTLDEKGLDISTELFPDAFGNNATIFDPKGVVTQNSFDRRSLLTQNVQDAGTSAAPGLCLTTQQSFNGQGTLTSRTQGDNKVADQYTKIMQQDGLSRAIGNVVDPINQALPQALNLVTQKKLDLVGRVIAETDANGNTTWSFHDLKGRLRFKVDPMGGVAEFLYNPTDIKSAQRIYAAAVDTSKLNDQMTLEQLQALVVPDNTLDSYTRYFQDANKRERFCIEKIGSQGIVHEIRYDNASREVMSIDYAQLIDITQDIALTTEQLEKIMAAAAIPAHDRVTQKILDANGQVRFTIDPEGAIVEQIFDKKGRVITKITYATPIDEVTQDIPKTPEEMSTKLKAKLSPLDRATYSVFDNADREIFTVAAEGNVTQSGYDKNNNLLTECQYAQIIVPPADYTALVAQLMQLNSNSAVDRITTHTYDNGKRRTSTTDPNGNKTIFAPDALGQVKTETKADTGIWISVFDRAKRKTTRTAPGNVTQQKGYDNDSNVLMVTDAKSLADQRNFKSVYNKCRNLESTELVSITPDIKNVCADQKLPPSSGTACHLLPQGEKGGLQKDIKALDIPDTLVNKIVRNNKQQIVAKQDKAGIWTFYVRDNQGRKVFQVDNLGNITEYVRGYAFNSVTKEIRYANKIPDFNFNTYTQTGIPLAFVQAQKKSAPTQDITKIMEYDRRGIMRSSMESSLSLAKRLQDAKAATGDGALMRFMTYDMFRQKLEERDMINAKAKIYNNTLKWFDRNGNVVAECDANGFIKRYRFNGFNKEINRKEYFNPLVPMPTLATTLGELDAVLSNIPAREFAFTYDLNNNVLSETRKGVVVQLAVQDAKTGVWSMKDQPPADLTKFYTYNTQNKRTSIKHENGKKEFFYYDLRGNLTAHADVPRASFDESGKGIILTPLTVYTVNELNQTTQSYQFANGAKDADEKTYTANSPSIQDRETKFAIDKLDRSTGKIVDPDGLKLTTLQRLNAADKPIVEIDANGNTQRHFYDELKLKRFTIDGMGRITEWRYDAFDNIRSQRHYTATTDITKLSDQTTLANVIDLAKKSEANSDALRCFFYDTGKRERFRVDVVLTPTLTSSQDSKHDSKLDSKVDSKLAVAAFGIVTEKRYDLASREVQTTGYNQTIDVSNLDTMTTDQLVQIMSGKVDTQNDRSTYTIRDLKGQAAFIIDPLGFLTVQTFDLDGKVLSKTAYYNSVSQSWFVNPTVPPPIPMSDPRDQVSYNVYNQAGQLTFTVDGEGGVTKTGYDNQKSKIAETKFNNKLNTPFADYPTMLAALAKLTPDATNDRTIVFVRDEAKKLKEKIDAKGNSDLYTRNIFGKTTVHTDRNGNKTTLTWDNANRMTVKTWPKVAITKVQKDAKGKLTSSKVMQDTGTQDVSVYDNASNVKSIIKGANTSDVRPVNFGYDASNQRTSSVVPQAAVDNPSIPSSFSTRPETLKDVTTQTIFDPRFFDEKNNRTVKMYEKDENDQWTCYVRDSAGRLAYQINPDGAVIQYVQSTFGQASYEICFFNQITFSAITPYLQGGIPIPLSVMETNPTRDKYNDRTTTNTYDRRSDKLLLSKDPVLTYSIASGVSTFSPNTAYQYDAFRKCTVKTTQQTATTSSTEITWFNRNSKEVAVADPNQNLKILTLDAFSQEAGRMEYAKVMPGLSASLTLSQVQDIASKNLDNTYDRSFTFGFDLNGNPASATVNNAARQKIIADEKGKPIVKNLPRDSYTRRYLNSNTDKRIATIFEDNISAAYSFFDARDHKVADTGVARPTSEKDPTPLIPLTTYGLNPHGQVAQTSRFINGTNPPVVGVIPTAKNPDPANDQNEYTHFNTRGLPEQLQDAAGNLTGQSFTGKRKLARKWYTVTVLQPIPEETKTASSDVKGMPLKAKASTPIPIPHIDEKRFSFDPVDRPIRTEIRRDDAFIQSTDAQYNMFGDAYLEGGSDAKNTTVNYAIYRKTDQAGNIWLTNASAKNQATAIVRDLQGKATISMVSATQNITSDTTYQALAGLIALPINQIERTETDRNPGGRILLRKYPTTNQPDMSKPRDLPLQIQVNKTPDGKTLLTWPPIQVGIAVAKCVWLYPRNKPELKKQLPIQQFGKSCMGVDVSNFDSDIYQYEIEYDLRLREKDMKDRKADAKKLPTLYKTIGRVEFATASNKNSQAIVATVKSDTLVYLNGNTKDLTVVDLYQGDKKIAQLPVQKEEDTRQCYVDLKQYPSGRYSIKPVVSNNVDMPQTATFTVHTPIPAQQIMSREIPCAVQLVIIPASMDDKTQNTKTQVRVVLNNLPAALANNSIKLEYVYLGQDGVMYTQTSIGKPGKVLTFPHPMKSIVRFSLSLQINDKEWLPLYKNVEPASVIQKRLQAATLAREQKEAQSKSKPKGKQISNPFVYHHSLTALDTKTIQDDVSIVFPPQVFLYITPWNDIVIDSKAADNKPPVFEYLDMQMNHQAIWKALTTKDVTITSQGIVVNVSGLAPGNYPFRVQGKQGIFTVTMQGGAVFSSTPFAQPMALVQKTQQFTWDPWKNMLTKTDSFGNTTAYTYNTWDQPLQITQPPVPVTDANGNTAMANPITTKGYNIRGVKISTQQSNGGLVVLTPDAAGQVVVQADADNVQRKQQFDGFGRMNYYSYLDVTGAVIPWQQVFNLINQMTQVTNLAVNRSRLYDADELGRRRSETDEVGNVTRYLHDALANIVWRYTPMMYGTYMMYDRNHQLLLLKNPDGTTLQWQRDFFGTPLDGTAANNVWGYKDLSGAFYFFQHDSKRQVTSQISVGLTHGNWMQVKSQTVKVEVEIDGILVPFYVPGYSYTISSTPEQNLQFTYAGDNVSQAVDLPQNLTTKFARDSEDRIVSWQVWSTSDNTLLNDTTNSYDALARTEWITNLWMTMQTGWTITGDARFVKATLFIDSSDPFEQDSWGDFTLAGRKLTDDGIQTGSGITINSTQGLTATYTNGFRATETTVNAGGNYVVSTLSYWPSNLLQYVDEGAAASFAYFDNGRLMSSNNNSSRSRSRRAAQLLVRSNKIDSKDEKDSKAIVPRLGSDSNALTYDADGNQQTSNQQAAGGGSKITYTIPTSGPCTGMGLATHQETDFSNGMVDQIDFHYDLFSTAMLSNASGFRKAASGGMTTPRTMMNLYRDPNAIQNGKEGASDGQTPLGSTPQAVKFNGTYDGRMMEKLFIPPRVVQSIDLYENTDEKLIVDPNGNYRGSYTLKMAQNLVTTINLWLGAQVSRGSKKDSPATGLVRTQMQNFTQEMKDAKFRSHMRGQVARDTRGRVQVGKNLNHYPTLQDIEYIAQTTSPASSLSISDPMTRIDSSYMPPAPTTDIAQEGDTFVSIAESVYHDARFAKDIADLNGYDLDSTDSPEPGEQLRMPQEIENDDDQSDVSIPYQQFINTLVGNLRPDLQNPQPKDDDDDWWKVAVGMVVTVAACVAAQYWAAPALLTEMGAGAAATGTATGVAVGATSSAVAAGTVATAATTATVGATVATTVVTGATVAAFDAAAQGLLSVTGIAPFSTGGIIESGLTAAMSAGLGSALNVADKTASLGEQAAKEMARYGAVAAADQVIEMKLNLENSFSVGAVAASMAAGVANLKINNSMTGLSPGFLGNVEGNFVTSVVDQGISAALTAPVSLEKFVEQAVGSSIGTATGILLGDEMEEYIHPLVRSTSTMQTQNQQTPNSTPSRQITMTPQQQAAQNAIVLSAENVADQKLPSITIDGSDSHWAAVAGTDLAQDSKMMSASAAASNSQAANAGQVAFGNNGVTLADRVARFNQPVTQATNSASIWSRGLNALNNLGNSDAITRFAGMDRGTVDVALAAGTAFLHPIDDIIKPLGQLAMDAGVLAFDGDNTVDVQQAAARMDARGIALRQAATTAYNNLNSNDLYTQGRAMGGIVGMVGAFAFGGDAVAMVGEGAENAAARVLFEATRSPDPAGAMARQTVMLQKNTGYNITPISSFNDFPVIGKNGTYMTDYQAIADAIGPTAPNQEYGVGLVGSGNQFSFFKARTLELNLGLETSSLRNGFRFSSVPGINRMPLLPVEDGANQNFLGVGQGLPNGGPEIKVKSLPVSPWPWNFTM